MKKLIAVALLGLSFGAGAETLLSLEKTRSINLNTNDPDFGIDDPLTSGNKTYESSCVLDSKGSVTLVTKFGKLSTLTKKTTFKIDAPLIRSIIDGTTLIPGFLLGDIGVSSIVSPQHGPALTTTLKAYKLGKPIKRNGLSKSGYQGVELEDSYHNVIPSDAIFYNNGVESYADRFYNDAIPKDDLMFRMTGAQNVIYLEKFMEEVCK